MLRGTRATHSLCNVARGLFLMAQALLPVAAASPGLAGHGLPNPNSGGSGSGSPMPAPMPPDAANAFRAPREPHVAVYRAVPSTRSGRAAGFLSLAAQLAWDRLISSGSGSGSGGGGGGGGLLAAHSHERIVATLCRMRGAVLKLGQMVSIQDGATVPPHVAQIFARVRDSAYAMPSAQLNKTLAAEYGNANWRTELFAEFDDEPMAAASIGQVHRAVVREALEPVAVKVQYPGVMRSIDSDVANLRMLMSLNLLPPGMFAEKIAQELREELSRECQYRLEAAKQKRFMELLAQDERLSEAFIVPRVYETLSTDRVLVTQLAVGVPIDRLAMLRGNQEIKNCVVERMMLLTLSELFRWRFMQTDPNYSNFLFDAATNKVSLIDFGAAREYDREFVRDYLEVVASAAREDRDAIIALSIKLGFLTGNEMREMLDAHVTSVILLGKPFRHRDRSFDFSAEHLPSQIQSYVPTMIKLRLRPPPTEIYSLHRRLSGIILLATKLQAIVPSGKLFWDIYDNFK